MANYGYGYGNYTSQPQQFNATYGYTTQPATRVVQGYQAGTAYGTAGYAQAQAPPVQAVPASSGGYGYFQRASDQGQGNAYTQKSNFSTSQGYGYGSSVKPAYTGTSGYEKQGFSGGSSFNSGYNQRNTSNFNTNNFANKKTSAPNSTKPGGTHQNAYEKVVFNAATTFLTQQAQTSKPSWQKSEKPTFKLPNQKNSWAKNLAGGANKPQQLHYCEVCKISCAGPQTYKEHLEGQKHKKKAASASTDSKNLAPGTYKCELCDVICTGKDAFNAHVKGASHTKTLKLHQKLGKPIPDIKPIEETVKKANVVKTTPLKMNFVGGTKLSSTGVEEKIAGMPGSEFTENEQEVPVEGKPVGEEYIEDIKSDVGKVIGYKCTLCDCRFNDNVAKSAHVKGRRHRLTYKKKVDPKLRVDQKGQGSRKSRGMIGEDSSQESVWRQRQQEQMRWEQQLRLREEELQRWEHDEYMRRASEDRYWTRPDRNRMHELDYYEWESHEMYMEQPVGMFPPQGPPPPTPDDRLVMSKHSDIYPTEAELKQVQSTVAAVEKALKLVSDTIGDKEDPAPVSEAKEIKKEPEEEKEKQDDSLSKPEPLMKTTGNANNRVLKGVMRVGPLCTGLLLKGQLSVELVVVCADKPTKTLLTQVGKLVPEKLKESAPEAKYNMAINASDCMIVVTSTTEPKCTVKITLTSPAVRDDEVPPNKEIKKEPIDEKDVLDKERTLEALAALRHAKWFQARANQLTSCVITIRIMRDLCQRISAFKPLSGWAIELLCEKALGSYFHPLAPGEAFRRVLEAIASGIFLPGGTGLLDPCEKEKTDAVSYLTPQEREDITAAAQQSLRHVAFRQIHKVLGVEPLKPVPNRKRRADSTSADGRDVAKVAKKED